MITKYSLYLFSVFFLFVLLIFTLKWSGVGDRMELRLWIDGNWSNLLLLIIMVIRVSQKNQNHFFWDIATLHPLLPLFITSPKHPLLDFRPSIWAIAPFQKQTLLAISGAKNGTLDARRQQKRPLFPANNPLKWWIRHLFHLNITSCEFWANFENCLYSTLMMMMVILLCIDGNWGLI